jgi:hypothetical protein
LLRFDHKPTLPCPLQSTTRTFDRPPGRLTFRCVNIRDQFREFHMWMAGISSILHKLDSQSQQRIVITRSGRPFGGDSGLLRFGASWGAASIT